MESGLFMFFNELEAEQLATAVGYRGSFTEDQHWVALSFCEILFFYLIERLPGVYLDSSLEGDQLIGVLT